MQSPAESSHRSRCEKATSSNRARRSCAFSPIRVSGLSPAFRNRISPWSIPECPSVSAFRARPARPLKAGSIISIQRSIPKPAPATSGSKLTMQQAIFAPAPMLTSRWILAASQGSLFQLKRSCAIVGAHMSFWHSAKVALLAALSKRASMRMAE